MNNISILRESHAAPTTKHRLMVLAFVTVSIAGCATYEPKPLDTRIDFPKTARLTADPATFALPALRTHVFDPRDGLDRDEVAMLAVANNPQLKVARDQAGEAHAQAFAAGLLPDPQVSLSRDFPTNGGPGNTSAFNLGVNFNLTALLLRSSSRAAAGGEARRADLELLWQEWQTANQARLVFVRVTTLEKARAILTRERALFVSRYAHSQAALAAGNRSLDAVSADLAALQAVSQRGNDLDRQVLRARHDLNALLGLDPEAVLTLNDTAEIPPIDAAQIEKMLPGLANRRPDLLALQWGYHAQEARLRQAVLAQFPPLDLGLTRARDTSALFTQGFVLNFALPLLNRNQGPIAQEKATRERLHDEFRLRLAAAYAEVRQLLDDGRIMNRQLTEIRRGLVDTTHTAKNAEAAFAAGNLNETSYVQLSAAAADKRLEALTLNEALTEQRIALEILLGAEIPGGAPKP